jgi:hypothetical protein
MLRPCFLCFSPLTAFDHFIYFRFLVEEGRAGMPKMMTVGLHCRLAQPGRVSGLAEFIDYAKKYKDVWICTREEIADFWQENHSPVGGGSPMKSPMEVEEEEKGEQNEELSIEPLNIDGVETKKEAAAAAVEEKEEEGDII